MGGVFGKLVTAMLSWLAANPDKIGLLIAAIVQGITSAQGRTAIRELIAAHENDPDVRAFVKEVILDPIDPGPPLLNPDPMPPVSEQLPGWTPPEQRG